MHGPRASLCVKRVSDVVLSLMLLVVLSPLFFLIAVLIVLDSGWPPWFVQDRVGLNGRRFRLFKFRTMVVNAENTGAGLWIERNDLRLTPLGRVLRRSSLDELPQLWNVLTGEMSLAGPRPLHVSTVSKLTPEQDLRHRMRPGITGGPFCMAATAFPIRGGSISTTGMSTTGLSDLTCAFCF